MTNDVFLSKAFLTYAQFINLQEEVALLPLLLEQDSFFNVMKFFEGKTVKFPTIEELKMISENSDKIIEFFKQDKSKYRDDAKKELRNILKVSERLSELGKRNVLRTKLTDSLLQGFFQSYFEQHQEINTKSIPTLSGKEYIELYKMKIKDAKLAKEILAVFSELLIKKNELADKT